MSGRCVLTNLYISNLSISVCREYTQISARDITEYQYENADMDGQTSIQVEKYQIGRADQDPMNDLVSFLHNFQLFNSVVLVF